MRGKRKESRAGGGPEGRNKGKAKVGREREKEERPEERKHILLLRFISLQRNLNLFPMSFSLCKRFSGVHCCESISNDLLQTNLEVT